MALHRTERIMDQAQSNLYGQLNNEGRRQYWNGWMGVISRVNLNMIHRDAAIAGENPITWNGRKLSIKGLIAKFASTFGKGSVA